MIGPFPKPKFQRVKLRRLPERKAVTVCIAGIQEDREGSRIFLVCDRRISMFGGYFSHDGFAKYKPVHKDWVCMFAGGVEETNLMIQHVNSSLRDLDKTHFEAVVDCCRGVYGNVRKRLIETQILADFDIKTYAEYRLLKTTDEVFYLTVNAKIEKAQEDWNLLFAGFDDQQVPHLFVISGPGNVQYCDAQKFAAIGSGSFAAQMWLSFIGCHSRLPIGQVMYGLMSAKFFAERASDVGPTTIVSMIESGQLYIAHINDEQILKAKESWGRLPKYSDEVASELGSTIQTMKRLVNAKS